ncbi:hypothetical protein ANACOL_01784 [Anaerotruncus colihominis DSM 17241]|uniref:Uncharacterized protein n=1 Tax=Anaerotruncus colihominis DSM 17241 TaxID=445972 RepID=B0PAI4_9FIRM|nr:hypothetical protein ANACOL_01784 [Anaerotruncus colihominis DSM 17241]
MPRGWRGFLQCRPSRYLKKIPQKQIPVLFPGALEYFIEKPVDICFLIC